MSLTPCNYWINNIHTSLPAFINGLNAGNGFTLDKDFYSSGTWISQNEN